MELELAKQGKELMVEHEARMNIIKEEVERDIRSQLRRQAAAHSDHLQDMLSVQVRLSLLLILPTVTSSRYPSLLFRRQS